MVEGRTTPQQRAALRDALRLATPRPWEASRQEAVVDTERWSLLGNTPHVRRYLGVFNTPYAPNEYNAALAAAAVNALPDLLADAEALSLALTQLGILREAADRAREYVSAIDVTALDGLHHEGDADRVHEALEWIGGDARSALAALATSGASAGGTGPARTTTAPGSARQPAQEGMGGGRRR